MEVEDRVVLHTHSLGGAHSTTGDKRQDCFRPLFCFALSAFSAPCAAPPTRRRATALAQPTLEYSTQHTVYSVLNILVPTTLCAVITCNTPLPSTLSAMSEPSSKLDMTSLNEALEASGEAENPTKVKAPDEQARETMNKSNTLTADAARQSPETLSPASPSGSPMPDTLAKRDGSAVVPGQNDTNQPAVEQQPLDPTVQQIKSMFPDLDLDTIQAVVSAEGGDFERGMCIRLSIVLLPTHADPPRS